MGPMEKTIKESPATHRLVFDILKLADNKDAVDAYYDCLSAAKILKERMNEALGTDH